MLPVGSTSDARRMDAAAIQRGTPSLLLMENAAFSLYLAICRLLDGADRDKIVVFAGKGGNGGDGMALLRILADRNCPLPLYLVPLFDPKELRGDPLQNYRILPRSVKVLRHYRSITGKPLFVDALLGTGLAAELLPPYRKAVDFINNYKDKRVLAVDVPTGLSGDTGAVLPVAVRAEITVTLGIIKKGLFLDQGPAHAGTVVRGPIAAEVPHNLPISLAEDRDFRSCTVPIDAHKGGSGRLLVIGGHPTKIGASFIAAESFLAAGGGLATVALPEKQLLKLAGRYPSVMLMPDGEALAQPRKWDVVICGPGLHEFPKELDAFLLKSPARLILDAGIFDHADDTFFRRFRHRDIIFTPHPGELARISARIGIDGRWDEQVQRFPLGPRQILYAKNAASWIRHKDQIVIVPFGARGLSFGGTGDALAGILAAVAVRFDAPLPAAVNAGLLHRRAGILLETEFSPRFHRISALIEQLGPAQAALEGCPSW